MPLTYMIKYIIITLHTLNCINMILSDIFEGGEGVYRLNYLKDKHIINYVLLCFLYILYICGDCF